MRFEINAMLFKDLTQGIRNKTFIGTFFGLLGLSALISFLVITSSSRSTTADGGAAFMALCGVIYFYIIYLGARCRGLIARDINHRTMELLLLSGMLPEKSVIGRLLTVLYQLFFGLCCVIPFMFAAYFLGGLDLILIIAAGIAFDNPLSDAYARTLITRPTLYHDYPASAAVFKPTFPSFPFWVLGLEDLRLPNLLLICSATLVTLGKWSNL